MEEKDLKIGAKNGCLTIIGDLDTYNKDGALERKRRFEEEKQEFLDGVWHQKHFGSIDSADYFDSRIKEERSANQLLYKCRCKCGKVHHVTPELFLAKRHRYCDIITTADESINTAKLRQSYSVSMAHKKWMRENGCGLRQIEYEKKLEKAKRIPDNDYEKELTLKVHGTLEVLGEGPDIENIRENNNRISIWLSKSYRCKCYLCGKEQFFTLKDFEIRNDDYGPRAGDGYYSDAWCECHNKPTSFEWRTMKIFVDNNIDYRAEVSFDDLVGVGGKNLLRFDFAVYEHDELKALIECQGKQHYEPSEDFGYESFLLQQKNDELKRQYAKSHGIKLIEIPYKCNTFDKESKFLLGELSY